MLFIRHCEQIFVKFAWQSINLNANLPLDCHEFARLRFANSRNDKPLSYWLVFVILYYFLSYWAFGEVSTNSKCDFSALRHILNSLDFLLRLAPCNPLGRYAQNDKGLLVMLSFRKKAKYPLAKPWKFQRYAKARCKSLKQSAKIILFKTFKFFCFFA